MTISLTPEQLAWLSAHVAKGEFASIDDAARQLIDERIAERIVEDKDDVVWMKPYVDEALSKVAAGKVQTLSEYESRIDALLAAIKG